MVDIFLMILSIKRYTDRQMRRNQVTELLPLEAEYIFERKDSRGKQIIMKHISQELSYSKNGVTALRK